MAPWSAPRLAGTGVGPRCGACSSSSSGSSPSSRRRRTKMNTIAPMPSSTSSAPATIRIVENPLPPPLPDALVVPGWGRALSGTGWLGSATAGAETVGVAVASSDNVWKLYDCPACTLAFLVTALYPSLTASIARVPGAIGLTWVTEVGAWVVGAAAAPRSVTLNVPDEPSPSVALPRPLFVSPAGMLALDGGLIWTTLVQVLLAASPVMVQSTSLAPARVQPEGGTGAPTWYSLSGMLMVTDVLA